MNCAAGAIPSFLSQSRFCRLCFRFTVQREKAKLPGLQNQSVQIKPKPREEPCARARDLGLSGAPCVPTPRGPPHARVLQLLPLQKVHFQPQMPVEGGSRVCPGAGSEGGMCPSRGAPMVPRSPSPSTQVPGWQHPWVPRCCRCQAALARVRSWRARPGQLRAPLSPARAHGLCPPQTTAGAKPPQPAQRGRDKRSHCPARLEPRQPGLRS